MLDLMAAAMMNLQASANARLVHAIQMKESTNNVRAYNKAEDAAGCMQIRPGVVTDVNEWCKWKKIPKKYTLDDRYDKKKSEEMFWYYAIRYKAGLSFEKLTRQWNGGGPHGMKYKDTVAYHKDVVRIFIEQW